MNREKASPEPAPAAPREEEIAAVWAAHLELPKVLPDSNFFELGGDSNTAVRILLDLEERYGREFPVNLLYLYPTVAQLAEIMTPRAPLPRAKSLVQIQPGAPGRLPFYWVPGATGSDSVLLGHAPHISRLARALGPDLPVYSVYYEYPADERPLTIQEVAEHLAEEIVALQPSGPYAVAGWSFGGIVAFELARQLRRRSAEPGLVALLDSPAAGWPRRRPWPQRLGAFWRKWQTLPRERQLSYPFTGFPKYFSEQFAAWRRRVGLSLSAPSPWEHTMRMEHAYFAEPRPYAGPVVVIASESTLAGVRHRVSAVFDAELGWGSACTSVETHTIPGDHHSMFQDEGIAAIAGILRPHLGVTAGSVP